MQKVKKKNLQHSTGKYQLTGFSLFSIHREINVDTNKNNYDNI